MFTNDSFVDISAIVADYTAGADMGTLAERYSHADLKLKKSDISAYLRLQGVPIRRGNPNLATHAAAARTIRSSKALTSRIQKLVATHGHAAVATALGGTNE